MVGSKVVVRRGCGAFGALVELESCWATSVVHLVPWYGSSVVGVGSLSVVRVLRC